MAEVALDASVIVGILYDGDVHHERARQLQNELKRDEHEVVILDFLVHEAVSVLCRRANAAMGVWRAPASARLAYHRPAT